MFRILQLCVPAAAAAAVEKAERRVSSHGLRAGVPQQPLEDGCRVQVRRKRQESRGGDAGEPKKNTCLKRQTLVSITTMAGIKSGPSSQ